MTWRDDARAVSEAHALHRIVDVADKQADAVARLGRSLRRTQSALIAVCAWALFITLDVWGVL